MPWTKQQAEEAARRSAASRARSAMERSKRLENPPPAQETFEKATGTLALELVDAALGQGAYTNLAPDKRLAALIKALEFGIGRPASAKSPEAKPEALKPEDLFS